MEYTNRFTNELAKRQHVAQAKQEAGGCLWRITTQT